ncbi:MAG: GntR family transcriptional regulator [Acidobacteriota bacterium]|jgi:DNA-binding transcriptional regulator YhcF (GntR family)|nr:GntR family transcriptional regulator [Acidobacteriota bacterium]
MRIWLSKNSEVPVREQLATQIILGIVSWDLKPGQKLPSTRELARRFKIHSNTVSAAYRDLAERGWVELRKGSGIYVREHPEGAPVSEGLELDHLISVFLQAARAQGYSLAEIQARVKRLLEAQPPDHFLVIESDEGLQQILVAEIKEATGFRVVGAGLEACADPSMLAGAAPVALYGQEGERIRAALSPEVFCLMLHSRSVPASMQGRKPPPPDALVAVVSHWPEFLRWARTMLVAAGIDPAALSFRDAREDGWQRGLRSSAFVITDALTATQLPEGCDVRVFRLIADSSLDELRSFIE